MPSNIMPMDFKQRLHQLSLKTRIGVLLTVFLLVLIVPNTQENILYLSIFFLFALLVNFLRYFFLPDHKVFDKYFIPELFLDVVGIALIVFFTGGINSNFLILFFMPTIYSTFMHGLRRGLLITAFTITAIAILTMIDPSALVVSDLMTRSLSFSISIIGIAFFMGFFSDELIREQGELSQLNEEINHKNRGLTAEKARLEAHNKEMTGSIDQIDSVNESLTKAINVIDEESKKMEAVLSSIANGLYMVSKDQKIIMWNKSAEEILGYKAEEVIGKNCYEVIRSTDPSGGTICEKSCKVRRNSDMRSGTHTFVTLMQAKNGNEIYLDFNVSAVYGISEELIGIVHVFKDVTLETLQNDILQKQALTDDLTQLYNRRYIRNRMLEELNRSKRYGNNLGILMIDIDHFKDTNDTFGHDAGDVVLKGISRILQENLRQTDILSRYGGEEFLVVLPDIQMSDLVDVGEKLRVVTERTGFDWNGNQINKTISLGATLFDPLKDEDIDLLISRSDSALYLAKRSGRNKLVFVSA